METWCSAAANKSIGQKERRDTKIAEKRILFSMCDSTDLDYKVQRKAVHELSELARMDGEWRVAEDGQTANRR